MKKPGKAKPKKRARKAAPAPVRAPAMAVVPKPEARPAQPLETKSMAGLAPVATAVSVKPLIKLTLPPQAMTAHVPLAKSLPGVVTAKQPPKAKQSTARRAVPRAAPTVLMAPPPAWKRASVPAVSRSASPAAREDRTALALLLAPFLIVAVSLGSSQNKRPGPTPVAPDLVVRAPAPPPPIAAPGAIAYPPAQPEISVAMLDVRPAPPPVLPAPPVAAAPEVELTGPALAYPSTAPEVPLPAVAALTQQVAPPFAPGDIVYPPPPVPPSAIEPAETACRPDGTQLAAFSSTGRLARAPRRPLLTGLDAETLGRRLSAAAVAQTRDLVIYTARYQAMAYPMGDVVALHGACIDVIIRAYREIGIDLQEEVQKARGRRGDTNIDHRRTENMRRFLEQKGASLPITQFPEDYKPGDIVTYHRPFSRVSTSHIAIVTDILAPTGRPMIIHNRGYGAQLEDALFVDRITGHYRYHGPTAPTARPATPASSAAAPSAPVVRVSLPTAQRATPVSSR